MNTVSEETMATRMLLPYIIMIVVAIIVMLVVFRLIKKRGLVPKLATFLIMVLVFFGVFFMFIDKPMQSVHVALDESVSTNKAEHFIEGLNAEYPIGDYWAFGDMSTIYAHYPDNSYTILFKSKYSRFEMKKIVQKIKQNSNVENCEANSEWFWDDDETIRQHFK